VALKPDQPRVARGRECLGGLGLPDARLALEQQRLLELGGQEDGGGQRAVREIVARCERLTDRDR
jgi:hypothetical protein